MYLLRTPGNYNGLATARLLGWAVHGDDAQRRVRSRIVNWQYSLSVPPTLHMQLRQTPNTALPLQGVSHTRKRSIRICGADESAQVSSSLIPDFRTRGFVEYPELSDVIESVCMNYYVEGGRDFLQKLLLDGCSSSDLSTLPLDGVNLIQRTSSRPVLSLTLTNKSQGPREYRVRNALTRAFGMKMTRRNPPAQA